MKCIINQLVKSVDHLPGPNCGAETRLKYQNDILSPAVEVVREVEGYIPELEELILIHAIMQDFIDEASVHLEHLHHVAKRIGGVADIIAISPRDNELKDEVTIAKSFVRKIKATIERERVEDAIAQTS